MSGGTLHERGLRAMFHDAMRDGLDVKALASVLDDVLRPPAHIKTYIDFVFQHSWDATTVYDAYAYAAFVSWWHSGLLGFVTVEVGHEPAPNAQVEENNRRLRDLIPGFSAEFEPGSGTGKLDDGAFDWSFDIEATTHVDGQRMLLLQPPGRARLEVGSTKSSRTIAHLCEDGALARWPYGSKKISLAILTPKGRETFGTLVRASKAPGRVVPYDREDGRAAGPDGMGVRLVGDAR